MIWQENNFKCFMWFSPGPFMTSLCSGSEQQWSDQTAPLPGLSDYPCGQHGAERGKETDRRAAKAVRSRRFWAYSFCITLFYIYLCLRIYQKLLKYTCITSCCLSLEVLEFELFMWLWESGSMMQYYITSWLQYTIVMLWVFFMLSLLFLFDLCLTSVCHICACSVWASSKTLALY